jgi:hypothetical protein
MTFDLARDVRTPPLRAVVLSKNSRLRSVGVQRLFDPCSDNPRQLRYRKVYARRTPSGCRTEQFSIGRNNG